MPDPNTLSLIGAATGIVGAITGIAGAILGYISYRRSQEIKALDLRMEFRKQLTDTRVMVQELPELLKRARRSRDNVLVAMGTVRTGAHEAWKANWAVDVTTAEG